MESILDIKKQHVSAYHWPSSDFILEVMLQECYKIIANIAIIATIAIILTMASDRPKHVVS